METFFALLSYLSNRKQRVKVNNTFSSWKDLIQGVSQGSVLGLLLSNIYLNDFFFHSIDEILNLLERNIELGLCWFEN